MNVPQIVSWGLLIILFTYGMFVIWKYERWVMAVMKDASDARDKAYRELEKAYNDAHKIKYPDLLAKEAGENPKNACVIR